ncbi:MAG: outer membrane lipid asymmetry maintenance protein MlaD [Parvularculaceae bacterium]
MVKARFFETIVGLAVIAVAAAFLVYAYGASGRAASARSYPLKAVFGKVDGVSVGSEVRIAGVKVGAVTANRLDPKTYEALLSMSVQSTVEIPEDSIAKIVSDGLIGGAHVSIEPGGSDVMLASGDTISYTQGSVDLLGLAVQTFTNSKSSAAAGDNDPLSGEAQ